MDKSSSILNFLENLSNDSEFSKSDSLFSQKIRNAQVSDYSKEELEYYRQLSIENSDNLNSCEKSEIILSVYWKRGKLGAAYYNCHTTEVHLLNDVIDVHPDFNYLKVLINQVQPSFVLTCGSLPDLFGKSISEAMCQSLHFQNEEISKLSKNIIYMPSRKKDLGYESCKRYILGLKLGFEPETTNEKDHILFINSHIDLAQESMVISLGMLIKYLERYLPQANLSYHSIQIAFLSNISLENLVSMDETTYKALQIFNPKVHPSPFKRNLATNREGLSLYGIFNRCKSTPGLKKMKEIFMHPSKNVNILNERLDAIEFCSKPQHQHIIHNMLDCIKKIDVVTGVLASIYRTRANINHWKSLYKTLYNAILIGEICQKHSSSSKLLEKVASSITRSIFEVAHYMNRVINFEESSAKNRFIVQEGIYAKLDTRNIIICPTTIRYQTFEGFILVFVSFLLAFLLIL